MNTRIRHALIGLAVAALCGIYIVGCASTAPQTPMPPRQTPLPNQPYVVKIAETGMWKWQYVASNNILIAESYETFDTPQEALRNYRAAREAFLVFPAPRLEKEQEL
jgi:hypothetical protein